jgi:formylglycine-generating enzyme required for sulfatase activity
VATLRSDFLPRLEDLGELRPLALRAPIAIGPLSPAGLRRAITEPARCRGVVLEEALVTRLVAGVQEASLPLLELALAELWERRDPAVASIGVAALDALCGVGGALAAHADATLAGMAEAERHAARRLLLALITTEGTPVRREDDELVGEEPGARSALDALVKGRLVVVHAGERGASYEISHEALVSAWPTLRSWRGDEAAVREQGERVRRAAAEWERLGRGDDGLFSARQLERLDAVAREGATGEASAPWQRLPLAAREAAFVEASRAAQRRARHRRALFAWGIPLLLVAVVFGTWGALVRRHRVAVARLVDEARGDAAGAEETARDTEALRTRALASFERDDVTAGEELWKQVLAGEERADARRRDAEGALDRALALDPRDANARALYADSILARLLAAERAHQDALASSLEGRLGLYDDGSRAARLRAPGRVRVETVPPGATLTLARYREDAAGHRVEADLADLTPGASRDLAPGSYVLHAVRAGSYPTTYPFVVHRGEMRDLRVVLPRAEDVPASMVYVPGGRFFYGSGDDEATRAFLSHQPIHEIEIGPFLIGRTEVTYADYVAFLRALSPADREALCPAALTFPPDGRAVVKLGEARVVEGERPCFADGTCADLASVPVAETSVADGERFAAWLSWSGRLPGARLCTDREWERAGRGADDRRFPTGRAEPGPAEACVLDPSASTRPHGCVAGVHPATRSPFGVDDMTGSVWEWTAGAPYAAHPEVAAGRGGSWADSGLLLALTNRGFLGRTARLATYGLRICADVH